MSSNPHQELRILQDLILSYVQMDDGLLNHRGRARRRKSSEITDDNGKKTMHREMERKRRKEIVKLHGSLRSLLPLEYIKGKRSLSDHINETVNYIKQLQHKIKELGAKRDELKKANPVTLEPGHDASKEGLCPSTFIMVHPCPGGLEIMVNSGFTERGLPLSRVLQALFEEGLVVDSCVSTKVNERLIYTIQSEINDMTPVDLPGLQQKLTEAIPSPKQITN